MWRTINGIDLLLLLSSVAGWTAWRIERTSKTPPSRCGLTGCPAARPSSTSTSSRTCGAPMAAADLLAALTMSEDVWEAAEAEREKQMAEQALEKAFLDKWVPVWRIWGVTQPGYEWTLT